jgi:hypothetical protein
MGVGDDARSWRVASTSAAPVPFAGLNGTAGAFGYLPKCLQMRDSGLFGLPRSHNPRLAIWLDRFHPIGAAEWNDPVSLHEARYGDDPPRGATRTNGQAREGSGSAGRTLRQNWLIVRRLW